MFTRTPRNRPFLDRKARISGLPAAQIWDRLIMLANRAPLSHRRSADGRATTVRSASGLVTVLEPLVAAHCGVWVAHGNSVDRELVTERDGLSVPGAASPYRLRYVWSKDDEFAGFYHGFANEGLWPLCHAVNVSPIFRVDDFRMYEKANRRYAAAVVQEAAGSRPLILVQDYHFALAPAILRQQLESVPIVSFWHVPWPRPQVFTTCPFAVDLLTGLLGSDIIGVQTQDDCLNFLGSAERLLDATVDHARNVVRIGRREVWVRPYPVGIETSNAVLDSTPAAHVCREEVCRDLGLPPGLRLGVGVDRLDYTKGIQEKLLAVERLLEIQPELQGRFVFVQVVEPSRSCLPAYRDTRSQIVQTCERVNDRFGRERYQPIHLIERHMDPAEIYRLYRAADVCYVGSLHDGMNLVAKEFVLARHDLRGVLVLSVNAGAAGQLRSALMVNPRNVEECAQSLRQALEMSIGEQSKRMRLLRGNVETFDASWWADELLNDVMRAGRGVGASMAPVVPRHASGTPTSVSQRW